MSDESPAVDNFGNPKKNNLVTDNVGDIHLALYTYDSTEPGDLIFSGGIPPGFRFPDRTHRSGGSPPSFP